MTLIVLRSPLLQWVVGPIQDDEALLLYSIVRGMRLQTILEVRKPKLQLERTRSQLIPLSALDMVHVVGAQFCELFVP